MAEKEKDNKTNKINEKGAAGTPTQTLASDETKAEVEDNPSVEDRVKELENRVLYLTAEVQNVRKRLQKEKLEHGKYMRESLLNDFFVPLLNLNKALEHYDGTPETSKRVCDGIKMTTKSMEDIFTQHGVKFIKGVNCPFDPKRHEALATEARDDLTEKTVIEEYEPGFTVHDQLVRAAKVKVGVPVTTKPSENGIENGKDKNPANKEDKEPPANGATEKPKS